MRLKGRFPPGRAGEWLKKKSREECINDLKTLSGMDFGDDAVAWEKWWREERIRLDIDPEF